MPTIPLGDILLHHARQLPPQTLALRYPDGEATWFELDALANRRARWLADLGVKAGDMVTLALPNSRAFFEITFGLWKLGATPNPVSARLPLHELQAIVDLARPRVLICDLEGIERARRVSPAFDAATYSGEAVAGAVSANWKAMTSGGSTGRPKVIVDAAPGTFDPDRWAFGHRAGGRILSPGPLYHNAPFATSHYALFKGSSVTGLERFDAEECLRLIARDRLTWACMVPAMMHRIWSLPAAVRERYDLSSLEVVMHVASAIAPWLKRAWIDWLGPERVYELYGGTEGQGFTWISGVEWLAKPGSVGRIQGESSVKVVREDGLECAPGETGEVFFRPAAPTYRYIGAEARALGDGSESIGDLGWLDEDGYLFLADRRTDLILRGGANVYPAEVEAALDAHPAVGSSIVVGLPDDELGARVHAIVQPKPGANLDLSDLDAFIRARLVRYKTPESYEIAAEPLRDDAGKARRAALREDRVAWLAEGRAFRLRPQAASEVV